MERKTAPVQSVGVSVPVSPEMLERVGGAEAQVARQAAAEIQRFCDERGLHPFNQRLVRKTPVWEARMEGRAVDENIPADFILFDFKAAAVPAGAVVGGDQP